MSNYNRALAYMKPYKQSLVLTVLFNFLYAIFNVGALTALQPVLKILFSEDKGKVIPKPLFKGFLEIGDYIQDYSAYIIQQYSNQNGEVKTLAMSCALFISLFLFRNIANYLSQFFFVHLKTGVTADLRNTFHQKLLQLPIAFYSDSRKGDIITRISNDIQQVEGAIFGSFVQIIRSPIMMIVFLTTLFAYNFRLTLFVLLVFPVMGGIISIVGKNLKKHAHKAQEQLGELISNVEESLSAISIIKIFNAEDKMHNRFEKTNKDYKKFLDKVFRIKEIASPTSEFLGAITICLIVFYGGKLSIEGKGMDGSAFLVYIGLFYTLLDPIKKMTRSISDIQKGQVSLDRIFEIVDAQVSIKDTENALDKKELEENISFKNISFAYEQENVLKNFNLTIPKGKSVALVGQSGSGKSTLANLITRFYDVNKGVVTIDGEDIKNIKIKDYRELFGMVTQKSILFNDTIFNNIALGIENPTEQKIIHAAKIANAHEFIVKLPEGYQTMVGEAGGKLSGGQQQRLSIARAVLKNPPIMILDEATSALDTESEKMVQEALNNMMKDRTSLIIAHRLSTIKNADLIVVMKDGEIVEQGNHSELIAKKGMYHNLINMQNLS